MYIETIYVRLNNYDLFGLFWNKNELFLSILFIFYGFLIQFFNSNFGLGGL